MTAIQVITGAGAHGIAGLDWPPNVATTILFARH